MPHRNAAETSWKLDGRHFHSALELPQFGINAEVDFRLYFLVRQTLRQVINRSPNEHETTK